MQVRAKNYLLNSFSRSEANFLLLLRNFSLHFRSECKKFSNFFSYIVLTCCGLVELVCRRLVSSANVILIFEVVLVISVVATERSKAGERLALAHVAASATTEARVASDFEANSRNH